MFNIEENFFFQEPSKYFQLGSSQFLFPCMANWRSMKETQAQATFTPNFPNRKHQTNFFSLFN
jgi:hypothetical protein